MRPHTLRVYGSTNPSRNVVNLFAQYIHLLPCEQKNPSLYKYALSTSKRSGSQWYSDRPVGVNQLKKVVKGIMCRGGLEGKYTNHSLRATCTTRMFEAGVDEQLIKNFTGHKSDAVCEYKRVSETLLRKASSTITGEVHVPRVKCVEDPVKLEPEESEVTLSQECKPKVDDAHVKASVSKSSKSMCPVACSNSNCLTLCSVLRKLDGGHDSKAKKVKLSLEIETRTSD